MSKSTKSTSPGPSRPEDPVTQRLRRTARLLRVDMLPAVASLVTQAEDRGADSETEQAMRRAVDRRKSS
jgi:hypothetical protein